MVSSANIGDCLGLKKVDAVRAPPNVHGGEISQT
jgi:hypothetical protein